MADLSFFKLDSQTITIKDTTARQAAESAKTLATTASGNATTALNKINELESEKADTIISSASGAIASFRDGAEMPVDEVKVSIEPVQDLHGYDSPWPAGGGKNVLDFAQYFTEGETVTQNGVTATFSNGYLKVTGTNTTTTFNIIYKGCNVVLPAGTYIMPNNLNILCSIDGQGNNNYAGAITAESSVQMVAFYVFASTNATVDYNIPMMLVKGTTRPTAYAPYSNICPISGWTGAKVMRTGKNLYAGTKSELKHIIYGGQDNDIARYDENWSLKPGTYTLSLGFSEMTEHPSMFVSYLLNGTWHNTNKGKADSFSFTLPEGYTRLNIWAYAGTYTSIVNIQIELGATATAYEPYQGETYDITFPSEAGTVYGGTLTVNEDGTGRLVVDRTIKKLNELPVRTAALKNGVVFASIHNFANQSYFGASGFDYSKITCTVFETKDRNAVWSGRIGISSWNQDLKMIIGGIPIQEATPQAVGAWLSSLGDDEIVVWPLLEPVTYALTALEVLETLKGVNNIWADTGDMSVTYRADTKLYIDNKFTELQALILENLERRNRS